MGVVGLQAKPAGCDERSGSCKRNDNLLGSPVRAERAACGVSRESRFLQRALCILLQLLALCPGPVHSGGALHLGPGLCVQLHRLLVLWL